MMQFAPIDPRSPVTFIHEKEQEIRLLIYASHRFGYENSRTNLHSLIESRYGHYGTKCTPRHNITENPPS